MIPAATRSSVAQRAARRAARRRRRHDRGAFARSGRAAEGDPPGDLRFSTDLFITPGFRFRAIDALLTNFHLPQSTLLCSSRPSPAASSVLAAYAEAVREGYLFYSYGDAMLVA